MEETQVTVAGPERGRVIVPGRGSALRRLAEDHSSRKTFLRMVGGGGAASALALLLAACGGDDEEDVAEEPAPSPEEDDGRDIDILNYVLTLEFLEAKLYRDVAEAGVIEDQALAQVTGTFGEQEQEHVDALTATIAQLGGTSAEDPQADFRSVIEAGPDEVLATAARVENVGAAAYLNEMTRIQTPEILAAALAIHTVEARHAAALNDAAGIEFTGDDEFEGIIPDGAFAGPADMDTVMEEIEPFLGGGRGGGNQ